MLILPFESSCIEKNPIIALKLNHKFGNYFNPIIMLITHAIIYVYWAFHINMVSNKLLFLEQHLGHIICGNRR
jgi:hypothetical protein